MNKGLEALEDIRELFTSYDFDLLEKCSVIEKALKAVEFLRERIVINEMDGYVEFYCGFSLPTNSKYENEEHYKEKIALLKEVLNDE